MGKDAFKYIAATMSVYLLISGIEIFLLNPLVDFIGEGFWIHLIVYTVLLLVINPIVTKLIDDKLIFKKKEI